MIGYMKVAVDLSCRLSRPISIWEMGKVLEQALPWQVELLAWVKPVEHLRVVSWLSASCSDVKSLRI